LLNYKLSGGIPAGSRGAWSRQVLVPLGSEAFSPLSQSILAEVASRAWFRYYDQLGYDPMPRARVVRTQDGRAFFNLSLSAQREAEQAAIEPISFMIDGAAFPIAKVEQQGFLASFKTGRAEKRMTHFLEGLKRDSGALAGKMQAWDDRVRDLRWTQADILMVMEEIEPDMVEAFAAFLGVRQNLLLTLNRIQRLAKQPPGETLRQLDRGLGATHGVREAEIARRLSQMAAHTTPALRGWIEGVDLSDWHTRLREAGLAEEFAAFLADYGTHATALGEVAEPTWLDDPTIVVRALNHPPASPTLGDDHPLNVLIASVDAKSQKQAQALIDSLRGLVALQSETLHALSSILAGTRRWALGAAREGMLDNRLRQVSDIYTFELEEIKQMMTGEWNISSIKEIHERSDKRRAQAALWRGTPATDLYIGDSAGQSQDRMEPSVILEPALFFASAMRNRSSALENALQPNTQS
jgi:hypothetical protein